MITVEKSVLLDDNPGYYGACMLGYLGSSGLRPTLRQTRRL